MFEVCVKFPLSQVALRETFELLDNPECGKLGRQSWVVITIVVTELLICIKFGWATITITITITFTILPSPYRHRHCH